MKHDHLERAMAAYNERFERELADAIIRTIADASMVDGVMVIRTGEAAAALTTVLASILALSPAAVRSPTAIREAAEGFRRKLQARVRAAEQDPQFADFKSRCFRDDDRERGGRA
jgi:hypothetical protein